MTNVRYSDKLSAIELLRKLAEDLTEKATMAQIAFDADTDKQEEIIHSIWYRAVQIAVEVQQWEYRDKP